MKKSISFILALLFIMFCFSSCSKENTQTETEEPSSVVEETTAAREYIEPTAEELEELFTVARAMHGYDCEADDAVEDAYSYALFDGGVYQWYADGKAFEKSERIVSEEPDPRGLTLQVNADGTYEYSKTPADSVDRFMKEIMNVEPDHNCEGHFNGEDITSYYLDGYYYTMFGLYGGDGINKIVGHKVTDDGWDEVTIGYYEDFDYANLEATETVTAKIIMLDGERYWSIKEVGNLVNQTDIEQ